eukprot:2341716-Rhodomonas_salina.1
MSTSKVERSTRVTVQAPKFPRIQGVVSKATCLGSQGRESLVLNRVPVQGPGFRSWVTDLMSRFQSRGTSIPDTPRSKILAGSRV